MARSPSDKPEPADAYDKALALLARREHSARELKTKLARRGLAAEDSDAAVAKLQSKNFQSDARFGEMLVRSRIEGGYGPRWIVAELRTHGIAETAARKMLDATAPAWPELARRQLRRRYGAGAAATLAERAKRATFLLRRGFDAATVKLAVGDSGLAGPSDEAD